MTIFETVKAAVTPKMAAERYGLNVGRNNMVRCPFHDDHHPSMKLNEDTFFCFGCGAKGDVIEFTSRLYDLKPLEAAKKLETDFNTTEAYLSLDQKLKVCRSQLGKEKSCIRLLQSYLQILRNWKTTFAPKTPDDEPDPRFVEACHMCECIQYMLNLLTIGSREEKADIVYSMTKDNKIALLQQYLLKIKENANKRK